MLLVVLDFSADLFLIATYALLNKRVRRLRVAKYTCASADSTCCMCVAMQPHASASFPYFNFARASADSSCCALLGNHTRQPLPRVDLAHTRFNINGKNKNITFSFRSSHFRFLRAPRVLPPSPLNHHHRYCFHRSRVVKSLAPQ
ncbi:hypothetical protein NDU88_005747 [Pleurodeles waltl]|uniref:Secreted protein n=1 Tax=Pleurodeles waltl TaxID=8319 RepID=A0AAV7RQ46_PLEWA|nr:hypothetical protein NDU88_005747 [Pleurodeles waltl]